MGRGDGCKVSRSRLGQQASQSECHGRASQCSFNNVSSLCAARTTAPFRCGSRSDATLRYMSVGSGCVASSHTRGWRHSALISARDLSADDWFAPRTMVREPGFILAERSCDQISVSPRKVNHHSASKRKKSRARVSSSHGHFSSAAGSTGARSYGWGSGNGQGVAKARAGCGST